MAVLPDMLYLVVDWVEGNETGRLVGWKVGLAVSWLTTAPVISCWTFEAKQDIRELHPLRGVSASPSVGAQHPWGSYN